MPVYRLDPLVPLLHVRLNVDGAERLALQTDVVEYRQVVAVESITRCLAGLDGTRWRSAIR